MSVLERRYRRLLALLPRSYAEEAGPELLGIWIDGAKPGQRWPRAADLLDIVRLAFVVRYMLDTGGKSGRVALSGFVFAAQLVLCTNVVTALSFELRFIADNGGEPGPFLLVGFTSLFAALTLSWKTNAATTLWCAAVVCAVGLTSSLGLALLPFALPALLLIASGKVAPRSLALPSIATAVALSYELAPTLGDSAAFWLCLLAIGLPLLFDPRVGAAFVWLALITNGMALLSNNWRPDAFLGSIVAIIGLLAVLQVLRLRRAPIVGANL